MSIRGLAVGAAAACLLPIAANAEGGVQMQRDITWKLGLEIAEGLAEAGAKRNVAISVAVVDRAGRMRIFISSDNPTPHSIELARRKAYTARTFGRSTLEWRDATEPWQGRVRPAPARRGDPLGGGYLIKVGNETIGGVGVSGNNQAGDEGCAKAGVEKVADQLWARRRQQPFGDASPPLRPHRRVRPFSARDRVEAGAPIASPGHARPPRA
jgi:uncharacterized protein GlcG (DUF336 family)